MFATSMYADIGLPFAVPTSRLARFFYDALASDEAEDLNEAIDKADEIGALQEDLREDLIALQKYRAFYNKGRLNKIEPQDRYVVEEKEWAWTVELAQRMFGFVPTELYGKRPLPPAIQAMQPRAPEPMPSEPTSMELSPALESMQKLEPQEPEPMQPKVAAPAPEPDLF